MKLSEFCVQWWARMELDVSDGCMSVSTLASYRSRMRLIEKAIGSVELHQLSGQHLDQLRVAVGKRQPGPYMVCLSSILTLAQGRRLIEVNPVRTEFFSRQRKRPTPEQPKHHTHAEVLQLLERMPEGRERAAVALAGLAGLRLGEVCALRQEDLHLEDGHCWLTIRNNLVHGGMYGETTKAPKSGKPRIVPVCDLLHALLDWMPKMKPTLLADETGAPFRPWLSGTLDRQLHMAQDALGLPRRTFHELRKSAMFWWQCAGVKPWNVSLWAGHAGDFMAHVTIDHYTGLPEMDWEDAAKLED
jgi:integrase